jgi:hypothetical protein
VAERWRWPFCTATFNVWDVLQPSGPPPDAIIWIWAIVIPPSRKMTPATIDGCTQPPAHGSKPFSAIRKLRVSPRVVARFVGGSLLSLKSHTAPRSTVCHAYPSCIVMRDNITPFIARSRNGPPAVVHSVEEEHAARRRSSHAPWAIATTAGFALADGLWGPGAVTSSTSRV